MRILYQEQGFHHQITVYDTFSLYGEKGRFRVLQFSDGAVQGAMDLNDPARIVLEYPQAIIHLMECNNPEFEEAFIIGHGIGTIAGYFSGRRVKAAELDSMVAAVSRQYFGYGGNNVLIGDGRALLEQESAHSHDYIVLDAFTEKGTPRKFFSSAFFQLLLDKLAPQGMIIMNLVGKGEHDPFIQAVYAALGKAMPHAAGFVLPSAGKSNILLAAGSRPIRYKARQMAGFVAIDLPGESGFPLL